MDSIGGQGVHPIKGAFGIMEKVQSQTVDKKDIAVWWLICVRLFLDSQNPPTTRLREPKVKYIDKNTSRRSYSLTTLKLNFGMPRHVIKWARLTNSQGFPHQIAA